MEFKNVTPQSQLAQQYHPAISFLSFRFYQTQNILDTGTCLTQATSVPLQCSADIELFRSESLGILIMKRNLEVHVVCQKADFLREMKRKRISQSLDWNISNICLGRQTQPAQTFTNDKGKATPKQCVWVWWKSSKLKFYYMAAFCVLKKYNFVKSNLFRSPAVSFVLCLSSIILWKQLPPRTQHWKTAHSVWYANMNNVNSAKMIFVWYVCWLAHKCERVVSFN